MKKLELSSSRNGPLNLLDGPDSFKKEMIYIFSNREPILQISVKCILLNLLFLSHSHLRTGF